MKQYKLLKDLPFAKAGEILELWSDGTMAFAYNPSLPRFNKKDVRLFTHWFEEMPYFYTIHGGLVVKVECDAIDYKIATEEEFVEGLKSTGNYFETEEEAEKHLEWLKARAVIMEDTKGFKPDCSNEDEWKYCASYDMEYNEFQCNAYRWYIKRNDIFFASRDDLKYSLEVHEKEWKIYLGVEDE